MVGCYTVIHRIFGVGCCRNSKHLAASKTLARHRQKRLESSSDSRTSPRVHHYYNSEPHSVANSISNRLLGLSCGNAVFLLQRFPAWRQSIWTESQGRRQSKLLRYELSAHKKRELSKSFRQLSFLTLFQFRLFLLLFPLRLFFGLDGFVGDGGFGNFAPREYVIWNYRAVLAVPHKTIEE